MEEHIDEDAVEVVNKTLCSFTTGDGSGGQSAVISHSRGPNWTQE
jgi:hypothetical protein